MKPKWEVYLWVEDNNGGYRYSYVYSGNSAWVAICTAIQLKWKNAGMVKVEWA